MTREASGDGRPGAVLAAVLFVTCLGLLLAFGAVGVAADEHADNETVHEHPDRAGDEGDLLGVADWLGVRLGGMLGESAIQISEREYELASQFLDDEFEQRLSEYVEIAGDTDRESDAEAIDRLADTRETQENYIDTSEAFEETYEEYQEAVEAGEDERARLLARELQALAAEIDEDGAELVAQYERLSELAPGNLSEEAEAIAAHRAELLALEIEVTEEEFVQTELEVDVADEEISFVEPLAVTGEVRTVDGEPVSDGQVRIELDEQAETVRLAADGTFEAGLRPVTASVDTANASVTFEPDPPSEYMGSAEEVAVRIEQVEPTVELAAAPEAVAFGDDVAVSGVITVEGEPVPGVPLAVALGEVGLATVSTGSDGSFVVEEPLGPEPAAGERRLAVAVAESEMAVGPAAAEASVEIQETPTRLILEASDGTPGNVTGSGVLETQDGAPVAGQRVGVSVNGEVIATVETDEDGGFDFERELHGLSEETAVTVTAVYDGAGTNLGSSEAVAEAVVAPSPDDDASGIVERAIGATGGVGESVSDAATAAQDGAERAGDALGVPTWLVWALAGVMAFAIGYFGYRAIGPARIEAAELVVAAWLASARDRLGIGAPSESSDIAVEQTAADEAARPVDVPDVGAPEPVTVASFVDAARERHAAGEADEAIKLAYVAARRHLGPQLADGKAATHWEFFRQCEDVAGADLAALERLTEQYERATFAPTPVSSEDADAAIAATRSITEVIE